MTLITSKSSAKAASERCVRQRLFLKTDCSHICSYCDADANVLLCPQVLLARHKESTKYYAVKVLQKKIILKKKEVCFQFK